METYVENPLPLNAIVSFELIYDAHHETKRFQYLANGQPYG